VTARSRAVLSLLAALLAALGVAFLGPGVIAAEGEPLANEMCPVMKDRAAKAEHTVVHEGKTVFFCCRRCVAKFKLDPTPYLAELPQLAPAAGEGARAPVTASEPPGRLARFLGSFHPVAIHFPIALGIVAALFEALFLARGSSTARDAGRLCAMVAGLGAVVAAPLGWLAAQSIAPDELERHRWAGVAAAVLLASAAVLAHRAERGPRTARAYSIAILVAAAVVTFAAWSGGIVTRGPGAHAY